jgi:RNA polymerase sigma factor (sigma-70 family)
VTVVVNRDPDRIGREVPDPRVGDDSMSGEEAGERGGSGETFEAFFDRLLPRAIGVGRRILGSHGDAEDAAVEGLARAYLRWGELSRAAHRDAWVLRVTANAAYDQLRRQVRSRRVQPAETVGGDVTHAVELRETLVPLLRGLSRRQREVVILSYMVGLSQEEIADLIGCSVGSVKVHARRGIERLRGHLADLETMAEEER